jgi:hypothetical protein
MWSRDGGSCYPILTTGEFNEIVTKETGSTKRDALMYNLIPAITQSTIKFYPSSLIDFFKVCLAKVGLWKGSINYRAIADKKVILEIAGQIANQATKERKQFYKLYNTVDGRKHSTNGNDTTKDAVVG